MAIKEFGKLAKLKIKRLGSNDEPLEVMFNPTSYSERFSVEYKKRENANSGIEEYDYVKSIPSDFQLKFIIDGTGASDFDSSYLPVFKKKNELVSAQVDSFLSLTWYPKDGYPNPLTISWGDFKYHCRLKDVNIKYTLFDRTGQPLRAELDAKFIGLPQENRSNYENRFKLKLPSESNQGSSTLGTETSSATQTASSDDTASQGSQSGIVISVS